MGKKDLGPFLIIIIKVADPIAYSPTTVKSFRRGGVVGGCGFGYRVYTSRARIYMSNKKEKRTIGPSQGSLGVGVPRVHYRYAHTLTIDLYSLPSFPFGFTPQRDLEIINVHTQSREIKGEEGEIENSAIHFTGRTLFIRTAEEMSNIHPPHVDSSPSKHETVE